MLILFVFFFFFNDTATTEIYTLSLHDALPIWRPKKVPWKVPSLRAGTAAARLRETMESTAPEDRKSTRLNSSHSQISYAVFCLKKKKNTQELPGIHYYISCNLTMCVRRVTCL